MFLFFFQAEDGIRDVAVTGVQTCALPISLRQGMLPIVWAADDRQAILEAYNGLYLREEVQMEGLVRNIGSVSRFFLGLRLCHPPRLDLAAAFPGLHRPPTRAAGALGNPEE